MHLGRDKRKIFLASRDWIPIMRILMNSFYRMATLISFNYALPALNVITFERMYWSDCISSVDIPLFS